MTRRMLTLLFGALIACGLVAQEPGGDKEKPGDPPRLKKKKRDGVPPPVAEEKKDDEKPKDLDPPKDGGKGKRPAVEGDGPKDGKGKRPAVEDEGKKDEGGKGKRPAVKDDPIVPEDDRGDPEEDDKDILERIAKNISAVNDKLDNKELGEPTEQQQRDILKDIDALIKRSEQQGGGGGGGGGGQDNQDNKDQDKDNQGGGGGGGQQQPKGGGGGMGGGEQPKGGMSRAEQRKQSRQQAKSGGNKPRREIKSKGKEKGGTEMAGGNQPQGPKMQPMPMGGNDPGAGKGGPRNDKMDAADLTKDVWGHLPESLRAEMNAYSNPQPFMPRYDDLIKKYYKAIAEKGRKKGD